MSAADIHQRAVAGASAIEISVTALQHRVAAGEDVRQHLVAIAGLARALRELLEGLDGDELQAEAAAELRRLRRIEHEARLAVPYVLRRAQEDPRLGYHLGPLSEAWERLVRCEATLTGEDLPTVVARRSRR